MGTWGRGEGRDRGWGSRGPLCIGWAGSRCPGGVAAGGCCCCCWRPSLAGLAVALRWLLPCGFGDWSDWCCCDAESKMAATDGASRFEDFLPELFGVSGERLVVVVVVITVGELVTTGVFWCGLLGVLVFCAEKGRLAGVLVPAPEVLEPVPEIGEDRFSLDKAWAASAREGEGLDGLDLGCWASNGCSTVPLTDCLAVLLLE